MLEYETDFMCLKPLAYRDKGYINSSISYLFMRKLKIIIKYVIGLGNRLINYILGVIILDFLQLN